MKLVVLFLALVAFASATDYLGAQVLKVTPESSQQYTSLIALKDHFDFLMTPKKTGGSASILCQKEECPYLTRSLAKAGMTFKIQNEDVQTIIDEHNALNNAALLESRNEGRSMDWEAYHEYDEIMDWCDQLAVDYPSLVTTTDVGTSYEGRTMKLVKISTGGEPKPSIWVDGGIHAREWISPATTTFVMNELVSNSNAYQSNLDAVDFYFMPVINPDGYAFTFDVDGDRLWRKTRTPYEDSSCFGADPNRNWDFQWGESGISLDCGSDIYLGPSPFSEISQQVASDQVNAVAGSKDIYLTYHSYGLMMLYPWGYDYILADNDDALKALAKTSAEAILAVNGTEFEYGNSAEIYGPVSGATDDYSMGKAGFEYAYTIELRPDGRNPGFELPPNQILIVGEEMWAGFQVFMDYVRDKPAV